MKTKVNIYFNKLSIASLQNVAHENKVAMTFKGTESNLRAVLHLDGPGCGIQKVLEAINHSNELWVYHSVLVNTDVYDELAFSKLGKSHDVDTFAIKKNSLQYCVYIRGRDTKTVNKALDSFKALSLPKKSNRKKSKASPQNPKERSCDL